MGKSQKTYSIAVEGTEEIRTKLQELKNMYTSILKLQKEVTRMDLRISTKQSDGDNG